MLKAECIRLCYKLPEILNWRLKTSNSIQVFFKISLWHSTNIFTRIIILIWYYKRLFDVIKQIIYHYVGAKIKIKNVNNFNIYTIFRLFNLKNRIHFKRPWFFLIQLMPNYHSNRRKYGYKIHNIIVKH